MTFHTRHWCSHQDLECSAAATRVHYLEAYHLGMFYLVSNIQMQTQKKNGLFYAWSLFSMLCEFACV